MAAGKPPAKRGKGGRRRGRPLKLTDPAPDGNGTVADRIVDWVRLGFPADWSGAATGVSKPTVLSWLKAGARAQARLVDPQFVPSDDERELMEFVAKIERARAEGAARFYNMATQLALGGRKRTKTVTKRNSQGQVIEETTTIEEAAPDPHLLVWILEHRYPEVFPRTATEVHVDVTASTQPSEAERVSFVADAAESWLASITKGQAGANRG